MSGVSLSLAGYLCQINCSPDVFTIGYTSCTEAVGRKGDLTDEMLGCVMSEVCKEL